MGPAGEAPAVVTEAQGWRLHLSSRSSTGYAGVRKQEQASGSRGCRLPWASGRFAAYHTVDGRRVYIGFFDSAVEAAVGGVRAGGGVGGRPGRAARRERGALDWEKAPSGAPLTSGAPVISGGFLSIYCPL